MKETLVTISKRTGFAISTVSRVLSNQAGKYRISPKTVELILAEAKRCNYTPSLLAKGLRMKQTNTLGLLIPSVANPYFADIASVVIQEAKSNNYTVMVVDTMESEGNEQEEIRNLLSHRVDGIIVVPCGSTPEYLEEVDKSVPIVLIDRYFAHTSLPYVCTDNYRGGADATRLLLENGHRNILCIQGVRHSMPSRQRVRGYLDTLQQAGLAHTAVVTGDAFSMHNGYMETKAALNRTDRPTAIFALSNTILLGAVKAIRESVLRIPEDISIVSFDNNPYLDFLVPAITRISQPLEEIGKTAVRLLLESIRENSRSQTQLQLAPHMVHGGSVKQQIYAEQ
ncbi:LacI family DNA-binding transcriptional regulator [uncultured Alistipes sp.]|uniref:LacI family DNA-binding transcriptional regulator n=1 Tax=uncultured Alistipes sp. TaxID=538949 RepID=UPI0025F86799|nr:LacI family DNA-binding transcriptional regulator [uncultured Alistipes sp.]